MSSWSTHYPPLNPEGLLEPVQCLFARIGDREERVQLRELEQGSQVLVETGQPELAVLFTNFLGEGNEHAQTGGVDVARLRKIYDELAFPILKLIEMYLEQEIMEGLKSWTPDAGVPTFADAPLLASAMHVDALAVHVVGCVRDQEADHGSDLFRLADAPVGDDGVDLAEVPEPG